MLPKDRLPFSPITQRPPLTLPNGSRFVLWPVLALEEWDIARPMARTVIGPPQGPPLLPDVATGRGTSTGCGSASGASSACSIG
jgi:hypothetical protein